jgi:4-hydroxythreonine-4-phosphate dehydrogenase
VLVGAESVVAATCDALNLTLPARRVRVWDPAPHLRLTPAPGYCRADAARAAVAWIEAATDACLRNELHGLVTAPINKAGLMKARLDIPGHTELLARRCGVAQVEMMLLSDTFRVVLATRHLPIRAVADALNRPDLRRCIETTARALDWLGCRHKRLAVCGLNPHAGDNGAIGDEEKTIITPVIRSLQRRYPDWQLSGPVPADTVFHQVQQGVYDAVVSMYHDQALAPFKMVAFETGVNLTLGLPIVRTSPDHGTAYGIAGQGRAHTGSITAAMRLAAQLARRPNPWRS